MRDIRFRAWHKYYKFMTDITDIEFDHRNYGYSMDNPDNPEDTGWAMFSDMVLMQYTGLKDKNGVKIFEGDVLNIYQYGHVVAEFAEGCYGAWDHYGFSPFRGTLFGYGGEVIGNIYENPELLKDEQTGGTERKERED